MAWTLHLLVWISVLHMCLSYNPPLPPFWGWGRQPGIYNNWQVAAGYKYPLSPQQVGFAPLDYSEENVKSGSDCGRVNPRSPEVPHDSRMNERSIIGVISPAAQDEARIYESRIEESVQRRSENGSLKILNTSVKPGRRRGGPVDSNQITFPGPTARSQFEPQIPENCLHSTFCEEIPNYPTEAINKLLERIGDASKFQVDKLDQPDTPDITQRVGPIEENLELCTFDEKVVYPQSVKSTDGKWYTLVNRKENPVQGFRVEICRQEESNCSNIAQFVSGYNARCKQKYVLRSVTVVKNNPDTSKLQATETLVKVPSCCSCVAKTAIIN